jgi:glutathione S-transferase
VTDELVLHGERYWISPYFFSSFVALTEKALPFTLRALALERGEQRKEPFRSAFLTGKIPALEHGPIRLAESMAIAEYLEEAFPPPRHAALLPEGAGPRGRARQVMAWLRSDLGALREERPTTTMFYAKATRPLTAAGARDAARLLEVAAALVGDGRTALFGRWCLADAELAFMLHRLICNGHELPETVRSFAESQWQRPSLRAFVGHERPAKLWPEAPELPAFD